MNALSAAPLHCLPWPWRVRILTNNWIFFLNFSVYRNQPTPDSKIWLRAFCRVCGAEAIFPTLQGKFEMRTHSSWRCVASELANYHKLTDSIHFLNFPYVPVEAQRLFRALQGTVEFFFIALKVYGWCINVPPPNTQHLRGRSNELTLAGLDARLQHDDWWNSRKAEFPFEWQLVRDPHHHLSIWTSVPFLSICFVRLLDHFQCLFHKL